MSTIRGTVEDLVISREIGQFVLRTPAAKFGLAVYILYKDTGVDTIDPTEMVRRNWMISLLQQSLTRGMEVTVVYGAHIRVQGVTLHSTITKQPLSAAKTTKGVVKKIKIVAGKGTVTIYGTTTSSLPGGKREKAATHNFSIYTDGVAGVVHPEESNCRKRVIGLLRQALADGLDVTVTHADKPNATISSAMLHAKA